MAYLLWELLKYGISFYAVDIQMFPVYVLLKVNERNRRIIFVPQLV
jgi:hypothetical protein